MRCFRALAFIALVGSLAAAAPVHAQGSPDPIPYALTSPPSDFEWGCFGPCACPIVYQSPMSGGFALRSSHVDPLYTYYDVLDVRWKVPDATHTLTITGSGTYRRGGEVALEEQLTLDLSFDGGPPKHFDSGLGPPGASFPEISTRIALHSNFCFDSELVVDAKPLDPAGVKDGGSLALSLVVAPNPFDGSTSVAFTLPRDGFVDLDLYDIAGRRVGALAHHEWLASGVYRRPWNGRLASGSMAPPGLYVVRLETASGQLRRTVAKIH